MSGLVARGTDGAGDPRVGLQLPDSIKPTVRDFLKALHPEGFHDLRAFGSSEDDTKTKLVSVSDEAGVETFIKANAKRNIYTGVAPRKRSGRSIEHCLPLWTAFVDLDFKLFHGGEPEARARLQGFPRPPSIVVHSGGGLHVYWLLTEPLPANDETKQVLCRLATALCADLTAAEPARVLRVPGTTNYKPAYESPRPVVLERFESRRYRLSELMEVLPPAVTHAPDAPDVSKPRDPVKHGISERWRARLARRWLDQQPPAIEGQDGRKQTYRVACAVTNDFDLTPDDACTVMRDWNRRCKPPWDDLRPLVRSALKYAKRPRGARLQFRKDKKGIVSKSFRNIRLAVAKLDINLRYDAFADKLYVGADVLDDAILNGLWIRLDDRFHFRPSKELLQSVVDDEARFTPVHPVKDYLAALRWDETPRIGQWLVHYGGAADTPFVRAVGAIVLIAAVHRVRKPGCKFDELLILESGQGTFKSEAMKALCPQEAWFSDSLPLHADAKVVIERTEGKWILEVPDMHGQKQSDVDQLKAMLSRGTDRARLAYGVFATERPRQWIAIGTTNKLTGYLKDATGARRFWPVKVDKFDVVALRRDRDQLWAEAAAREADGESIRLPMELWDAAAAEQEARRLHDPWEEVLSEAFEGESLLGPNCVRVQAVWLLLGSVAANSRNNEHADRVSTVMQRLGFTEKKKIRFGEETALCWLKPEVLNEQGDVNRNELREPQIPETQLATEAGER